jgi:hypothetical protein
MYIPSLEKYGYKIRKWYNPLRYILGKWYKPKVELRVVTTTFKGRKIACTSYEEAGEVDFDKLNMVEVVEEYHKGELVKRTANGVEMSVNE